MLLPLAGGGQGCLFHRRIRSFDFTWKDAIVGVQKHGADEDHRRLTISVQQHTIGTVIQGKVLQWVCIPHFFFQLLVKVSELAILNGEGLSGMA